MKTYRYRYQMVKSRKTSRDGRPPDMGYTNGNLFADLYDGYKNYKPEEVKAYSERDNMLLNISKIYFAAHELNLYLDIHPNDQTMLTLFNDYRKQAEELTRQYEAKYGPLNINSASLENGPFRWINGFPWEVGNV